jgi:hypothetical protein
MVAHKYAGSIRVNAFSANGAQSGASMTEASIRELKDVFTGELLVNGDWIVANVETTMAWPIEKQNSDS